MSNAAKLRKKAAEFETLKQFDRAVALYVEAVEASETAGEDVDVALLNKVGDLTLRQGRIPDAVTYYERAVEHYATAGLFNNAIALCNKILRSAPGRSNVYFTLGRICARKGLRGDASRNFLEYATRMQQDGRVDEGMRALAEIADLMPELTEVRRLVEEHAVRAGISLPRRRTPSANASVPDEAARAGVAGTGAGLVFLDIEYDVEGASERGTPGRPLTPVRPSAPVAASRTVRAQSITDVLLYDPETADPADLALDADADAALQPGDEPDTEQEPPARVTESALETPPAAAQPPTPGSRSSTNAFELSALPAVDRLDGLVTSGEFEDVGVTRLDGFTPDDASDESAAASNTGVIEPASLEVQGSAIEFDLPTEAAPDAIEWLMAPDDEFLLDEDGPAPAAAPTAGLSSLPPELPATVELNDLVSEDYGPASSDPAATARFGVGGVDPVWPAADDEHHDVGAELPMIDLGPPEPAVPVTPLEVEPVPELDAAIAAGAEAAQRGSTADARPDRAGEARLQFRLDPHEFVLAGELAPLVLDDDLLDGHRETDGVGSDNWTVGAPAAEVSDDAPADDAPGADTLDAEVELAAPPTTMRSTPSLPIAAVAAEANMVAASRRDSLRSAVAETPHDWPLRRRLAEALFEAGERDAALAELETAANGLLEQGDVAAAAELADELVRVAGDRVPLHQRRVELAVRLEDQTRLRVAYLDLADALVQSGDEGRARAVYARVLEIDPWDDRARAALGSAAPPAPATAAAPAARPDDSFVDLGDWLRDENGEASTRMRMREPVVSGDEQADFESLLRHFKEGVSRSLGEEDYESHYDLGVAYKEMGLLDDAIAEFQKALRSRSHRLPAYEALGQCFVEQERYQVAATVLSRALHEPGLTDESRVGVLYLLAYSSEALERWAEARSYYQRVYATDIHFRDVAARLAALDQVAR